MTTTPLFRNAGFSLPGLKTARQAFEQELQQPQSGPHMLYTRYGNPSIMAAEKTLSQIEGSEWTHLTASGMAAIDCALSIFQKPDNSSPWVFLSELYGGTNAYIDEILVKRRGIDCQRVYPRGESYPTERVIEQLQQQRPAVFFFEPISNPLLICIDVEKVIQGAKETGARVIVDNTFATSLLLKPLELGADLVIHSATKYLGGHGDLTAGVISGNDPELSGEVLKYRKLVGNILSPDDAVRLQAYSRTLELRVSQQFETAHVIARMLEEHQNVERVRYPGLSSHETHQMVRENLQGKLYGGVVTFDLKGGIAACDKFIEAVSPQISYVPTMGDMDTILLHAQSTFGGGYPDSMIRLSVGVEHPESLIATLQHALSVCR